MSGRVIVVGSINVDLVARVPHLPAPGETVGGGAFEQHHGGKGANQAVAARRLGAIVEFVGVVGSDGHGAAARAALVADAVGTGELRTLPGSPTGVALILVDPAGENVIAVAPGANAALTAGDVSAALVRLAIGPADVVLVSNEIPAPAVRAALLAARRAAARSILNPAPATGLDRGTFGLAEILTPNRRELASLTADEARRIGRLGSAGDSPERQARSLLEPNAEGEGPREAVVVTLGAAGALIVARNGREAGSPAGFRTGQVAADAIRAVDTTGAGDTFNGAVAAAIVEGRPLDEAVRRGVVAAGIATTVPGAREGMPTAAALADAGSAGSAESAESQPAQTRQAREGAT